MALSIRGAFIGSDQAGELFNSVLLVIFWVLLLGLLTGEREKLIEDESYKTFYMHGIGHYLGLDVHDVGHYGSLEKPRLFPDFSNPENN